MKKDDFLKERFAKYKLHTKQDGMSMEVDISAWDVDKALEAFVKEKTKEIWDFIYKQQLMCFHFFQKQIGAKALCAKSTSCHV